MYKSTLMGKYVSKSESFIRYWIDMFLILFVIPILVPVSIFILLLIFLDSGLPLFYFQKRVGYKGKLFTILKFRTMITTSDMGPLITSSNDKRVTRSGSFLRKWKLDELPQFVNILRNEMSLVGPRPELEFFINIWPEEARKIILNVKPGLVDPTTLELIQEEKILSEVSDPKAYYLDVLLPQKVKGYLQYLENRSLTRDYLFLLRALIVTFSPRQVRRIF